MLYVYNNVTVHGSTRNKGKIHIYGENYRKLSFTTFSRILPPSTNVYGSHLSSNLTTTSKIDSVILHFNCSITCSTHLKSYSTSMGRMVSNKK